VLLISVVMCATAADDIGVAAREPHSLAEYINSHKHIDFESLSTALNLKDSELALPACQDGQCKAEAIDVPGAKPDQTILWVSDASNAAFWLRFRKDESGAWRNLSTSGVRVKFVGEHQLIPAFGKQFLVLSEGGLAGKGLITNVAKWFDLTLPRMQPVFTYTSDGTHAWGTLGLVHMVRNSAIAVPGGTSEQIRLELTVHFQADPVDTTRSPIELGRGTATAYYVRQKTGEFKLAPSLSSAPKSVLDSMFDIQNPAITNEQFLQFDIVGLRRIASAPRSPAGQWLASFLKECKQTPEKTELLELLQ
jgi:hypothetical protein